MRWIDAVLPPALARLALVLLWGASVAGGSLARVAIAQQEPAPAAPTPASAFDYARQSRASQQLFEQAAAFARHGDWESAEKLARRTVELAPQLPANHYNLACVLALAGKREDSLTSLRKAVELGFTQRSRIEQDEDFRSLRGDPQFEAVLKSAEQASMKLLSVGELKPRRIENGVALVGNENTGWDPVLNLLRTRFEWPDAPAATPVVKGRGAVGDKLRRWFDEGVAAGNRGDLYDNCDRDHSNMRYDDFPQLTRVEYDPAIQGEVPFGLQLAFFHGGVVVGNSSTAHVGSPFWRSNPRTAYVNPRAVSLLYAQYRSSQIYVYPEHRDHDPGRDGAGDGYGDVFPANTPYLVTSQGSSGSDQVFLDAIACTLAAFLPATKAKLVETGMLMPAVQMIFRASNKTVAKPEQYLTGVAHPTVFEGQNLDVEKMIDMAHGIQPDALPPWVELKVVEEENFDPGRDYFDIGPREKLFDSPCSIARIYRATTRQRRMVVSAEGSRDWSGKPLKFHWSVLRGDSQHVRIRPLDEEGKRAEIIVDYSARGPLKAGDAMESNRVEVGVFVHNGTYYSAPAFISWMTLDNETREYDEAGRIKSVAYHGGTDTGHYVDPVIDLPKSWRDEYRYDDSGRLIGWNRHRGDNVQEFTAAGVLVLEHDALGRPTLGRTVRYAAQARPGRQPPILSQELGPERVRFRYQDDMDRVGMADREPWDK